MARDWRPQSNLRDLVLSFHHVGLGNWTQVTTLQAPSSTEPSCWPQASVVLRVLWVQQRLLQNTLMYLDGISKLNGECTYDSRKQTNRSNTDTRVSSTSTSDFIAVSCYRQQRTLPSFGISTLHEQQVYFLKSHEPDNPPSLPVYEEITPGAREVAQQWRALAALAEDPSSTPSIHMQVYNHP